MKKRMAIIACTLLLVISAGIIWYKTPINFTDLTPDEVMEIVVFDGNTGKNLHITEKDEIEYIIENLNTIKMKRNGLSTFYTGYRFKMTIYLTNGEEADGWNNFIINSKDAIRKDPFFYRIITGDTAYDYIWNLFNVEQQ